MKRKYDFFDTHYDTGSKYLYFVEWFAFIGWILALFLFVKVAVLLNWL